MKKFVIILLFLPTLCFAQTKQGLKHFWDIPWGTSIERAEAIFTERGFSSIREGESLITQAKYEGEDAMIVLLFNKANRLYCGNVIYPTTVASVIPKYDNYRKVMFRRYGMPDTAVEYFNEPYKKGDGKTLEAINTENAFYFTEWEFFDHCLASVSILKSLEVCLSFQNPGYADTAIGRR